jgi:hypothetical protein
MCIIAIKESGIEFPNIETMYNCFDNNPDGAGFMYPRAGKVHIEKGFLTWKAFKARYEKLLKTYTKKTPFIFHFRIGTHGAKTAGMTHPFPIGEIKAKYTDLEVACDFAFAHNGIFNFLPINSKFSDSVIYGRDILAPLYEKFPDTFIDNGAEKIIMATLGWSKLAFMRGDGGIEYFGHWEESKGVHFSNSTFEKYVYTPKVYSYDSHGFLDTATNTYQLCLGDGKEESKLDFSDVAEFGFPGSDKASYNKLIFIRDGDEWGTSDGLFFSGFDFRDDPFPSVARIGESVYQYDDYTDFWDYVGKRLKPITGEDKAKK